MAAIVVSAAAFVPARNEESSGGPVGSRLAPAEDSGAAATYNEPATTYNQNGGGPQACRGWGVQLGSA